MDERHIVAIDLGTSKFAVTAAKIEGDDMQVIYYKEHPSDGIRYSKVFNPAKAGKVLGTVLNEVTAELGIDIAQAVVGMPRYEVRQTAKKLEIKRDPEVCITDEEIKNLKELAIDDYPLEDREHEILFGAVAQSFSIGEEFQLTEDDIIGMTSEQIEANFKVFIGKSKPLADITVAFDKSGTGIPAYKRYFTPDSTAQAVLRQSEIDNGVALIDFGGGVTSVAIYYRGIMRHYASIPFGGKNITDDIKSEACITETLAENIKLAYGACMPDRLQSMSEKIIYITSDSAAPSKQIPVRYLSEIITARMTEIIEAVLYEIEKSGLADNIKSGIVITGGGANLANCTTLIKEMSGYNVRMGYPRKLFSASGCSGVFETGAATSIGLLMAAKSEAKLNCCSPKAAVEAEEEVSETSTEDNDPGTDSEGQGHLGGDFPVPEDPGKKKPKEPRKPQKPKKNSSIGGWLNTLWKEINSEEA